jgi:hypothetical protein
VDLEREPLCLVSTIEKLLEKKESRLWSRNREYGRREPSRPCGALYHQKLALILPANDGRSVGIVHSWTQAKEFFLSITNNFELNRYFWNK